MKELTVIQKTKGLHAQIENSQVPLIETGLEFLDVAINIDITDGNKILRRRGFTDTAQTTAAHSFFTYNGNGYCVLGTNFYLISQSLNTTGLRNGFNHNKVRYQGVGGKVYYSNGILNGRIEDGVSYPWEPSDYAGPRPTVKAGEVTTPPVCKHMCLYRGRMYMSEDSTLWYTPPFWYDGVNRASDFIQFSSPIIMLLSLDNLMVIATEEEVLLVQGSMPSEFNIQSLLKCRVIEDTGIAQEGLIIGDRIVPGKVGMFTTQEGIYAILNSGDLFDITGNRLLLPDVVSGNAYITDNFYTVLIDE